MRSGREGESISIRSYVRGEGPGGGLGRRGRGNYGRSSSMYLLNLSTIHSFCFFRVNRWCIIVSVADDFRHLSFKPERVLPSMGYIGMCGPKGYGFSAVWVINWVSILAVLPPFWS